MQLPNRMGALSVATRMPIQTALHPKLVYPNWTKISTFRSLYMGQTMYKATTDASLWLNTVKYRTTRQSVVSTNSTYQNAAKTSIAVFIKKCFSAKSHTQNKRAAPFVGVAGTGTQTHKKEPSHAEACTSRSLYARSGSWDGS